MQIEVYLRNYWKKSFKLSTKKSEHLSFDGYLFKLKIDFPFGRRAKWKGENLHSFRYLIKFWKYPFHYNRHIL